MHLLLNMINLLTFRGDLFHSYKKPKHCVSHPLDYDVLNEIFDYS